MGRQASLKKHIHLTDRNGVLKAFDEHTYGALDYKLICAHPDWKRVMGVALYTYTNASVDQVAGYLEVTSRSVYKWCHEFQGAEGPLETFAAWVQLAKKFASYLDRIINP